MTWTATVRSCDRLRDGRVQLIVDVASPEQSFPMEWILGSAPEDGWLEAQIQARINETVGVKAWALAVQPGDVLLTTTV